MEPPDDVAKHLIGLEQRLLQPSVRSSRDELHGLLHPEFQEVGASGRLWDRATMIDGLVAATSPAVITHTEMTATVLSPGVGMVAYVSETGDRRAHRTSIWLETDVGWQMVRHQGTPAH